VAETSLFLEPSTTLNLSQTKSKGKSLHQRTQSYGGAGVSRYAKLPTENMKFEKFVELLMTSKMTKEQIMNELVMYL